MIASEDDDDEGDDRDGKIKQQQSNCASSSCKLLSILTNKKKRRKNTERIADRCTLWWWYLVKFELSLPSLIRLQRDLDNKTGEEGSISKLPDIYLQLLISSLCLANPSSVKKKKMKKKMQLLKISISFFAMSAISTSPSSLQFTYFAVFFFCHLICKVLPNKPLMYTIKTVCWHCCLLYTWGSVSNWLQVLFDLPIRTVWRLTWI